MKPMQHAEAAIAGLVRSDGLAVWQGPACAGCEVHRSDQAWVLTRGLPEGTAATVGRRIAATREPGVRELLALTRDVGQLWPTRVGLRSAYVVALRHDRAREELIVADDDRGRAESSLQRLHLRHLGDLELDFQLARARRFLAMADDVRAPHAIAMAIWAARSALQYAPKEPLWRAKLALALALQPGIDDGALRELDRALALAPTMPEIRLVAAEVLSLRGDVAGARFQLATALRLSPNDPTIVAALARLGEE
jgi:tetratricopeptide (TPR) repeat protein